MGLVVYKIKFRTKPDNKWHTNLVISRNVSIFARIKKQIREQCKQ